MGRTRKSQPALSPEDREKQLIALAIDRVEERLRDGTASSAELVHFLKLASRKEQLEVEKLEEENKLVRAKTDNLQSQKKIEELYADAIRAMRDYSGEGDEEDYERY